MSTKGFKRPISYHYSEAFKQKIVSAIENGELSQSEARVKYGIGGSNTIHNWIKQMGKNELLSKKVRIETPTEVSTIKQLEARIKELEACVVQTQMSNIAHQNYLSLACEQLGIDIATFKKKQAKNTPKNI